MADTWAAWLADRMPQGMQDRAQAAEAAEAAAFEAEQVERAERQWAVARAAEARENSLIYSTGHSSEEWREAAQRDTAAREMRNMQAEYGSAERAAVFLNGRAVEASAVARTVRADSVEAQLARARQQPGREFMAREVARFDARQRSAGKHISRSETPGDVRCVECLAEGIDDPAESFLLHNDPQFGDALPETLVPDYAPSRSKRVKSGTGWPVIVR